MLKQLEVFNFNIEVLYDLLIINLLIVFSLVSIPEIQRLWVRFQQLGCNNYGVLPSTALTVYDTRAEVDPHIALLQTVFIN